VLEAGTADTVSIAIDNERDRRETKGQTELKAQRMNKKYHVNMRR
jgi:hypothetical protein